MADKAPLLLLLATDAVFIFLIGVRLDIKFRRSAHLTHISIDRGAIRFANSVEQDWTIIHL